MKKNYTIKRCCKLLMLVLSLTASSNAFAGGNGFWDFWATLTPYPTGAGKVYAELYSTATALPADNDMYMGDFTQPSEETINIQYTGSFTPMTYTATAAPADGWIFAGFSGATRDADGNFVFSDVIQTTNNPGSLSVTSSMNAEDQATALANFPFSPDTAHYALFTHVAPRLAVGHDRLGSVSIDKVCNDLGDAVTLTATPTDPATTTFDHWVNKNTGQEITDNPLHVQVTEAVEYEAYFNCTTATYIDFPDSGGYITYYGDHDVYIPDNVSCLSFSKVADYVFAGTVVSGDSLEHDSLSGNFFDAPSRSGYQMTSQSAVIMYGTGKAVLTSQDTATVGSDEDRNLLRYTSEGAVDTRDLESNSHFYSVDLENQQFHLMTTTEIPANTFYYRVPNESYEVFGATEAPETIYWSLDAARAAAGITGISGVKAETGKTANGVYTIDGKKVSEPAGKGLYIIDGKKVLKLK